MGQFSCLIDKYHWVLILQQVNIRDSWHKLIRKIIIIIILILFYLEFELGPPKVKLLSLKEKPF